MIPIIKTFLLAMTPIGELRIALPMGIIFYQLNWVVAYVVSVIGNIVPVILLLYFLDPVSKWLSMHSRVFDKFFKWLFERTRKKTSEKMMKYGQIALIGFVAIPLPFTGAWTGSIAAFLFAVPNKRAFYLISLGVLISGLIVLILTKTGLWLI
jgi:uncharacterized membrane protein